MGFGSSNTQENPTYQTTRGSLGACAPLSTPGWLLGVCRVCNTESCGLAALFSGCLVYLVSTGGGFKGARVSFNEMDVSFNMSFNMSFNNRVSSGCYMPRVPNGKPQPPLSSEFPAVPLAPSKAEHIPPVLGIPTAPLTF